MSDLESDTSWSQTINKICDSQILNKVELKNFFDQILSFDLFNTKFDQFYTSLTYYAYANLIQNTKNNCYSLDEINNTENIIKIFTKYLVSSRSIEQEQEEVSISLKQYLELIESIVTCTFLIDQNDLISIVTNIKNSKKPEKIVFSTQSTSINSLIKNFFNVESKIEFKTDNPSEQFSRICLRHLILTNALDQLLIELENSLTYLNVYRKNHLKQFSIDMPNTLMSYEEALQAKAK